MATKWTQYKFDVGQRVRAVRETLELDQQQIGEVLGIGGNAVSMMEKGIRGLDPERALRLKKQHGITLDYLFGGDPSALPKKIHDKLTKPKSVAPPKREDKRSVA